MSGQNWSSHFHLWIVILNGFGRDLVKSIIFLRRPCPKIRDIGFVPYLPVFYVVVGAVRPTTVVVLDNVHTDLGPFLKVFGRIDMPWGQLGILRRGTEAVNDPDTERFDRLHVPVGLKKVVAVRLV